MQEKQGHHHWVHEALEADRLGTAAELFARFFGTPRFLLLQTILIIVWIAMNVLVVTLSWDPYPFILLNLLFSTQAAYAAPLVLLASNRSEQRAKALALAEADHREKLAQEQLAILREIRDAQDQ